METLNAKSIIDPYTIRKDFPILEQKVHDRPLVYLDNGATTQKPRSVIEAESLFYSQKNSTIHRGIHHLSDKATEAYELARRKVQAFINARHAHEIIFTSGTTASINTIAYSMGECCIGKGDEVAVTAMEHHANIVPWQMVCERREASLRVLPMDNAGVLIEGSWDELLNDKTRLLAITHISNTLGTINPIKKIIKLAHDKGIPVLVDGAQSIQHDRIDVIELDCDFYAFSGHKAYGPTGIGVLYGKEEWLEKLPPFMGGGDMVESVSFEKTTYNVLPFKFEAGTTNYVGAIGLGVALDYMTGLGIENICSAEQKLMEFTYNQLTDIEGLVIYGNAPERIGIFSFSLDHIHHYDAGMILDKLGIAIRTGTHCAQPVMKYYGIEGTMRASLCFYNTTEEIETLVTGLNQVKKMLG